MKHQIVTWEAGRNGEELHHFLEDNRYLFGFNRKLLGDALYDKVRGLVKQRLHEIEQSPYKYITEL